MINLANLQSYSVKTAWSVTCLYMPLQCNVCMWSGRELPSCRDMSSMSLLHVSLPYEIMWKCVSHTPKTHPAMSWSKLVTNQEGSLAMWVEFDTSINYRLVTARAFTVPSSVGGQEATPTCDKHALSICVYVQCIWAPEVCVYMCVWLREHAWSSMSLNGPGMQEHERVQ